MKHPQSKIKLSIIDDHQIVIDGLKILLFQAKDIEITGTFPDGESFLSNLKNDHPDIILLDLLLPGKNGLEVLKELKAKNSKIKVLIFTGNSPEDMLIDAIDNGALGVLPKNASQDDLINAIKKVANGEAYFHESIAQVIINNYAKKSRKNIERAQSGVEKLSEREIEVIKLFAEGFTYKEIAMKLNISKHTVESHKNNILSKLELKTIIDIVKFAIRNNLIKP